MFKLEKKENARMGCGQEVTIIKPNLDGIVQRVIRTEGKCAIHASMDGNKLLYELAKNHAKNIQ